MKVNQEKCSVLEKARPSLREKSFQFRIARSSGQGQLDAVCNEKYEVEGGCNGIKIILLYSCKKINKKWIFSHLIMASTTPVYTSTSLLNLARTG